MQQDPSVLFRPLFSAESATWSYILADRNSREGVIIDPVLEEKERDLRLLEEIGINLKYIFETHIHADHITAASALKDTIGGQIVYGAGNRQEVDGADIFLEDGEEIHIGAVSLTALATPGHTSGCTSYRAKNAVFTGDALLIRGCGRTDFQSGSAKALYASVHNRLFTLPDDSFVYPAHDYKGMLCSTIGEEKKYNPRLKTGTSEAQFIEIMKNLKLAPPKKINESVPANKKAGRVPDAA